MKSPLILAPIELLESRHLLSATPAGAAFQINTEGLAPNSSPATAMDVRGDFVVAWVSQDKAGEFNAWRITVRAYSADGSPRMGPLLVSTAPTTHENFAQVAMDASGDFVVVWENYAGGGDSDIYARRFSADGTPLGDQFRVNTYTTEVQHYPTVAMDAGGDFVVVWQSRDDRAGPGSTYDVYAQRYDSAGQPQGGEFRVNQNWPNRQVDADVAMRSDGTFVVTWDDWNLGTVMGRGFDASGNPLGDEFAVASPANPGHPSVIAQGNGGFVFFWGASSYTQIGTRLYDSDLHPRTEPLILNADSTHVQSGHAAASRADGSFVVVWDDRVNADQPLYDVYAREYNADGVAQGDAFEVAARSDSGSVAMDPDGDYVLVWQPTAGSSPNYYPAAVIGQRYAHPPTVQTSAFAADATSPQAHVTFSEDVSDSLAASDLRLVNLTTGQTIDPSAIAISWDATTNTATFTFPGFRNGILPDGNYRATLPASSITDAAGNPMQSDATLDFFVLAGDANRDRKVDVTDLGILARNWQATGKYFSDGDFNYDGKVDVTDLGILATSWQRALAAAPSLSWSLPGRRTAPHEQTLAADLLESES